MKHYSSDLPVGRSFRKLVRYLCKRSFARWLPDKLFLRIFFWARTGKKLNIANPKTFSEKIQLLKLYDRKPEYRKYVDKYTVRSFIRDTIGEEYLIPLIGVYDRVEEIDWDLLPDKFVLKCTHASSFNIICRNKNELDIRAAAKKLRRWLKINWFWWGREWAYKDIKPRIICEKYLQDNIIDYKFMCFHGEPKLIQVHRSKGGKERTLDFYDVNWQKTEIRRKTPTAKELIPKPQRFDEMLSIVQKLAKDDIHVRIDLYEVNGKIYFGEKTYYSGAGFKKFFKDEHDEQLGSWLEVSFIDND